jgi:hypothetical protein
MTTDSFACKNADQLPAAASAVKKSKIATQEQCSCKVVNREKKFKAVSNPVWVGWKAMI